MILSSANHIKNYQGDGLAGDPGSTSIGEQDAGEQESLNEVYEDEEDGPGTDEVIDTNPEGTPPVTPTHGLVEEGPGPDA